MASASDDESSQEHIQNKGNFHGCYLLVSKESSNATYIGYTVNPSRRIKQHNGGVRKGGARKTSRRGPWEMILIVHGFPSDIAALRFEWAWQNPVSSRRIGPKVSSNIPKRSSLEGKLKILAYMLTVPPWCRFALTIRWLKQEYEVQFHPQHQPPVHMPIAYGLVDIHNAVPTTAPDNDVVVSAGRGSDKGRLPSCGICHKADKAPSTSIFLSCYHEGCSLKAHVNCLARKLCNEETQVIPLDGTCPNCRQSLLWGELVHRHNLKELKSTHNSNDESKVKQKRGRKKKETALKHWTEELHVN